ncbi:MAG: hypothetical protein AAB227_07005 [Pseudomonadota bacterium]
MPQAAHTRSTGWAGGLTGGLADFVVGKAVGPFPAVIGENGVNGVGEALEEALEKGACARRPAIGEYLDIDKARRPVDGDERVGAAAVKRGQRLDVEMNEAERKIGAERGRPLDRSGRLGGHAMAPERSVNGAARQLGVDAAMRHFDDVVERQGKARPEIDDEALSSISVKLVERVKG